MKLEIRQPIDKIDVLGVLEPSLISIDPEVYLDEKRAPATLERIILAGLNALESEYLDSIESVMKHAGRGE